MVYGIDDVELVLLVFEMGVNYVVCVCVLGEDKGGVFLLFVIKN